MMFSGRGGEIMVYGVQCLWVLMYDPGGFYLIDLSLLCGSVLV
jgi:hypothetical protein